MLQQRVVIEHTNLSRMLSQAPLQTRDHVPQSRLRKRVEKKQHDRLKRKKKLSRIPADRLNRETFLCVAPVLLEIIQSRMIQRCQKFHAHDAAKGIIGSHQQRSSFARPNINEDEFAKVEPGLRR